MVYGFYFVSVRFTGRPNYGLWFTGRLNYGLLCSDWVCTAVNRGTNPVTIMLYYP